MSKRVLYCQFIQINKLKKLQNQNKHIFNFFLKNQ
jgi:hypothetical protein